MHTFSTVKIKKIKIKKCTLLKNLENEKDIAKLVVNFKILFVVKIWRKSEQVDLFRPNTYSTLEMYFGILNVICC